MSFSPALVYDFIFLAVFSFAAVKSWQKGFLAGLTELIGAVLGVGIASWGSRTLAPEVYLSFFSDSVSTRVEQAVAQSGGDIAAAVQGLDFLPESIRAALAAGLQTAGNQLPEKINALLEPLFLPLVQALLFVLLCMIVRWVFALLVRLLRGVNLIPLVGGANRLLGLVLGRMTETNFRRALLISNGDPSIFVQSIYCKIFLVLIIVAVGAVVRGKLKEQKAAKAAAVHKEND